MRLSHRNDPHIVMRLRSRVPAVNDGKRLYPGPSGKIGRRSPGGPSARPPVRIFSPDAAPTPRAAGWRTSSPGRGRQPSMTPVASVTSIHRVVGRAEGSGADDDRCRHRHRSGLRRSMPSRGGQLRSSLPRAPFHKKPRPGSLEQSPSTSCGTVPAARTNVARGRFPREPDHQEKTYRRCRIRMSQPRFLPPTLFSLSINICRTLSEIERSDDIFGRLRPNSIRRSALVKSLPVAIGGPRLSSLGTARDHDHADGLLAVIRVIGPTWGWRPPRAARQSGTHGRKIDIPVSTPVAMVRIQTIGVSMRRFKMGNKPRSR